MKRLQKSPRKTCPFELHSKATKKVNLTELMKIKCIPWYISVAKTKTLRNTNKIKSFQIHIIVLTFPYLNTWKLSVKVCKFVIENYSKSTNGFCIT